MSFNLRWVDQSCAEEIVLTRLRCYAGSMNDLANYQARLKNDARSQPGDYLLADRGGETVGTTTSLSLKMWVRGKAMACQGVAWVGTIRTARRGFQIADGAKSPGVATVLMNETLRKGRERGEIVSALMPFRASFYEHFGYGVVERRNQWIVPLAIMPAGSTHGIRYLDLPNDLDAIKLGRQRQVEAGQCDIETSDRSWPIHLAEMAGGFSYIDRPAGSEAARGMMTLIEEKVGVRRCLRVSDHSYDSIESLQGQMHFLGGMKDQFHAAILTFPTDLPLNHLLRESQVPHRPVEHPASELSQHTRMQVRILDHLKFFDGQTFPHSITGEAVIAVHETEGDVSKFRLRIEGGRSSADYTESTATFECRDSQWAAIACGELRASIAVHAGLASCADERTTTFLDAMGQSNVAPFCREYF